MVLEPVVFDMPLRHAERDVREVKNNSSKSRGGVASQETLSNRQEIFLVVTKMGCYWHGR